MGSFILLEIIAICTHTYLYIYLSFKPCQKKYSFIIQSSIVMVFLKSGSPNRGNKNGFLLSTTSIIKVHCSRVVLAAAACSEVSVSSSLHGAALEVGFPTLFDRLSKNPFIPLYGREMRNVKRYFTVQAT